MRLIRGIHNLQSCKAKFSAGCVLTIGNFDGVHLGHRQVLEQVQKQAKKLELPSVVMFFEPLPSEYFKPEKAPVRLMNMREKLAHFQNEAIDWVVLLRFNAELAQLTAKDFVQQILLNALNIKHIIVGDDFCFGQNRQGNFQFLQTQGQQFGFSVEAMPTHELAAERISSTRVRKALEIPDLNLANTLMGHPFRFDGRVIHGKKLGRQLGFRTLNLNPKRIQMPMKGVFAVKVLGIDEKPWPGVANIGTRPTIKGLRPSIEVHLFNWHQDIYGQHVQVELQDYIRSEKKFDSLEALKQQITQDATQARKLLGVEDE